MNIFAAQAAQSTCTLSGCGGHLPTADGDVVHISHPQTVSTLEGTTFISRELEPDLPAAVRMHGCGDMVMTPEQALKLALVLVAEAFGAQGWEAAR